MFSDDDWKFNKKAVLCALKTFDVYQKEKSFKGSVKYMVQKSVSAVLNKLDDSSTEPDVFIDIDSKTDMTTEVNIIIIILICIIN